MEPETVCRLQKYVYPIEGTHSVVGNAYAKAHTCKSSCMQLLKNANTHECECLCAFLAQAADVYAFGILLWEMCTGQKPWVGLKEQEIITKVVQNEKQPLFPRDTPAPFKVHPALFCLLLFLGQSVP